MLGGAFIGAGSTFTMGAARVSPTEVLGTMEEVCEALRGVQGNLQFPLRSTWQSSSVAQTYEPTTPTTHTFLVSTLGKCVPLVHTLVHIKIPNIVHVCIGLGEHVGEHLVGGFSVATSDLIQCLQEESVHQILFEDHSKVKKTLYGYKYNTSSYTHEDDYATNLNDLFRSQSKHIFQNLGVDIGFSGEGHIIYHSTPVILY
jgi:hypothetical protein